MTGDDDTWFVACARTVRGSQCLRFKIHTCIFFLGYRRMNGWWPRSEAGSRPDGGSSGSVHHVSDKPYSGRYSIGVQKGGWRCNGRDHHLSVTHTHTERNPSPACVAFGFERKAPHAPPFLWQNRYFGPSTLSWGSSLSLNFQIGQYSLSTFVLRSNSSLCILCSIITWDIWCQRSLNFPQHFIW